jgi:hypothetical protein
MVFRWGVFAAACALLYLRFSGHQGSAHPWADRRWSSDPVPWTALLGVLALMLVNWGLEAWKWRMLVRPLQPLGYIRACAGTLAGTTIGLITPNRVGEFAGRVLFLEPEHRIEGSFATVLGSIAQFVVTLFMGGSAVLLECYFLRYHGVEALAWDVLVWSTLLIAGTAVVLFFHPVTFARIVGAIPWLRRFEPESKVLERFDRTTLQRVFALSSLRYGVFTLQFAVLVHVLAGVPMGQALAAVPLIFLVTTLVPTTALTELGVRSTVAAAFIPADPAAVVLATASIWVINIVLPALAGSVILLVARIRTTPASS